MLTGAGLPDAAPADAMGAAVAALVAAALVAACVAVGAAPVVVRACDVQPTSKLAAAMLTTSCARVVTAVRRRMAAPGCPLLSAAP